MKSTIFMFILLLFFCCSLKKEKNISEEVMVIKSDANIEKIILHYVSLVDIYTSVDISCEDFEKAFVVDMQTDTITEPNEIVLVKTYIENLKKIDSLSIRSMDTRAKFYFIISALDTIEYCINSGIVYSNGIYYEISDELFDYIENFKK